MMEGIGTMAAIGGLLLAVVLLWAVLANRKRSARDVAQTETGTREFIERVDREDQASDPDPKRF